VRGSAPTRELSRAGVLSERTRYQAVLRSGGTRCRNSRSHKLGNGALPNHVVYDRT